MYAFPKTLDFYVGCLLFADLSGDVILLLILLDALTTCRMHLVTNEAETPSLCITLNILMSYKNGNMSVIDVGDDIYNKTNHKFWFDQGFNFILNEIDSPSQVT